ncbi:MAG: PAS domain-containing protein, partial [Pseudomonadota bacterium]|nr:PAS domain-containing protein [Pseudomonadota bacterium]
REAAEAIYRLAQAARAGRRLDEEVRVLRRPDGSEGPAWYRIRVAPLPGEGGGPKAAVWTVTDTTADRERHEDAFQELQKAIDYLDHAPAGFFSAEPDGRVAYMNATLAEWLGHDLAEIAAAPVTLADILPEDGAALLGGFAAGGAGVRVETLDIDFLRKDGRRFPARLLHKVAFTSDGRPSASRTLVLNRSRGEDVAETLRAIEVRFARFFNSAPIGIAMIDRQGRITRANAAFARLFGPLLKTEGGEGRGQSLLDLVAERDRDGFKSTLDAALAGKGAVTPADASLTGEGSRSGRFYFSVVEESDGESEAAVVFAIETTEQRTLEAQFAQSQKMQAIGQLAGGIAHDFNNVLTAIIGYSDFLIASHKPTDPSFQDIMQIKHNANRAAGLVRQLLAFSRRQTLRPQVLALGEVLSDVSILLKKLLGEKVGLEVVHGRDLWPVKADLNQFEQVIINLAVNARDAMPDGGTLTLRTANITSEEAAAYRDQGLPRADYVLVEVTDTGTGIRPDIIDKIFEPFFSTKEVGKGTGLGLSTVYGIVKQTGGYVFPESEVGKGTTFRIFLPRHQAEERAEIEARKAEAPATQADLTGQGVVLLVEDEDAVRAFAKRALISRGYEVLEAATGADALAHMDVRADDIDLVVSDVVMPEMDGPTLLKEIRKRKSDLKIIFVSGYAEDAFRKNLEADETFVFLPKPFSLKQLAEAVKTTMEA